MTKFVLICGFNGKNNTAKLVLDKINLNNKIYLKNSFITSVEQLYKELLTNKYDYIFLLGQKPKIKSLYIESVGKQQNYKFITKYDVDAIRKYFIKLDYRVIISNNAGNYLCNNIYYYCLKYIEDKNLDTKALFLHIPILKNMFDIERFSEDLAKWIYSQAEEIHKIDLKRINLYSTDYNN